MLVLVDDDRARLAAWRLDRNDLFGEIARGARPCRRAAASAARRHPAPCAPPGIPRRRSRRSRHRIDAVLRLQQRIDEAPADRRVVDLGGARERLARLAHHHRRAGHRLDAAGDGEIHFAGADRARRIAHGVEPGGAQPVDRHAGNGVRQPGEQQRHARDIAVVLAGLIGAAEKHFVEPRPVGLRLRATSARIGTAARSSVRTLASAPP